MFINPDLRTKLTPSLARLAKYVQMAKANDSTRDTRYLMSWLATLPQIDQHNFGLIQTRKLALFGFEHRIDMREGLTASATDKKRIAEITARFNASKISSLFHTVMNGLLFGMSAARLEWENDTFLKTRVKTKVLLELADLDFDPNDASGLLQLQTDTKKNTYTSSKLDTETHLYVRYNPFDGVDNRFLGSLARVNMIYVWLKYDDMFNWAQANQKFGDPTFWASFMEGTPKEDIAKIEESLEQLSKSSRAAFSDKVKIQLLEAQRGSIADMHSKLIDTIKNEMSISYLGQTLTTDIGSVGSRAAAQVHNFVRSDYLWGDIIFFQNIITEQYITVDFSKNYSDKEPCPYVFRFNTDEIGDTEVNSRVIQNLVDVGIELRQDEVYRKTGFTQPQTGDLTINKTSPLEGG